MQRRHFLKIVSLSGASVAFENKVAASKVLTSSTGVIEVDATPLFELSPYLYMQFMEPLGTTIAGGGSMGSCDKRLEADCN